MQFTQPFFLQHEDVCFMFYYGKFTKPRNCVYSIQFLGSLDLVGIHYVCIEKRSFVLFILDQ